MGKIITGPIIKSKATSNEVKIPILIPARRIQSRVRQLARRISRDYRRHPQPPLMVGVLNGAFIFIADLLRNLNIQADCDFIRLSSYGKNTKSSGKIKVVMGLDIPVKGRDIIIVDDIIDTGLTAGFLVKRLTQARAKSVRVCALLNKPARRTARIKIDYPGFKIPNKFVVGYGIDYQEQHRQLDYIGYIPEQKRS